MAAGPSTLDSTGPAQPSPQVGGRALYHQPGGASATPTPTISPPALQASLPVPGVFSLRHSLVIKNLQGGLY